MIKKKEVIKHSSAIQTSNKMSFLQRRSWNILLANAYDKLPDKEIYEISISDLSDTLGFESNNIEYLKNALRVLNNIQVEWNILEKDKQSWGVFTLLSQVIIEDGICYYAYAPILREKLYNPTMYAKINLSLQNNFNSKHALILYELTIDYYQVSRKYGETSYISIKDLRKILGLNNDKYKRFGDLNKYVIKKALNEINTMTDIYVTVVFKKKGRSVAFIKFIIEKNFKNEDIINIPPQSSKSNKNFSKKTESLKKILDLVPDQHRNKKSIENLIIKYLNHGFDYIKRNIEYANNKVRDQRKYRPFLNKSLKDDWALGPLEDAEEERKNYEKLIKQRQDEDERRVQGEIERKERIKFYNEQIDAKISSFSDSELNNIKKEAEKEAKRLIREPTNNILKEINQAATKKLPELSKEKQKEIRQKAEREIKRWLEETQSNLSIDHPGIQVSINNRMIDIVKREYEFETPSMISYKNRIERESALLIRKIVAQNYDIKLKTS